MRMRRFPLRGWRHVVSRLHKLNRDTRGTGATEYLLLVAAVILPLALLSPLWFSMIRLYTGRLLDGLVLPFP